MINGQLTRSTGYDRDLPGSCRLPMSSSVNSTIVDHRTDIRRRDDDIVEIYCHRSEMGQGIRTSLQQVIADELEADWERIELLQGLGDERYGDQNTDGSTSIRKPSSSE